MPAMACTSATTAGSEVGRAAGGRGAFGQGREAGQLPANGPVHGFPEHGGGVGVGTQRAAQLQQAHHQAGQGGQQRPLGGRKLPGRASYTHSEPML